MIGWLANLFGTIVLAVVGREAAAWIWHVSLWVARRAAGTMPDGFADEYRETYLAELETLRDRPLTALIVSLRMLRGSTKTASVRVPGRPSLAALAAKYLVDVAFAMLAMVVMAPLMVVAGIAIRLTMGSPVLIRQERLGKGGSSIYVLKFRTMQPDRRVVQAAFIVDDRRQNHNVPTHPRITNVGRFLRMWSLDELPQFWNVVRGEMSLVGPRPRRPGEVYSTTDSKDPALDVRPGITGLWQVSSQARLEDMDQIDREYVRNWSLGLDIRLLLTTPLAALGLRRDGSLRKAIFGRSRDFTNRRKVIASIVGVTLVLLAVLGLLLST